jgi:hypothetical protein
MAMQSDMRVPLPPLDERWVLPGLVAIIIQGKNQLPNQRGHWPIAYRLYSRHSVPAQSQRICQPSNAKHAKLREGHTQNQESELCL